MPSLDVKWEAEFATLEPQRPFGARLTRLTSAPMISDDIYGEQPRCTPDGRRIAFRRQVPGSPSQLWICDFERSKVARVPGCSDNTPTAKYTGRLYCLREVDGTRQLVRLDLASLEETSLCDFGEVPPLASPCVTFDEASYFGLWRKAPHEYEIVRVDLATGAWHTIYGDPDICNPHLQTCPASGDLLVQHNRGCQFDDSGQILRLVGDEGATLFVIDADGGGCRQIPVGTPYSTWPTTGHECWAGDSGAVVYTESRPAEASTETGNTMIARPGDEAARLGAHRTLGPGLLQRDDPGVAAVDPHAPVHHPGQRPRDLQLGPQRRAPDLPADPARGPAGRPRRVGVTGSSAGEGSGSAHRMGGIVHAPDNSLPNLEYG